MTKTGAPKLTLGNTTVNSCPVRGNTIDDDPRPSSRQSVLNPCSNTFTALDDQCLNIPHEPFVRDLTEGFAEVKKKRLYPQPSKGHTH